MTNKFARPVQPRSPDNFGGSASTGPNLEQTSEPSDPTTDTPNGVAEETDSGDDVVIAKALRRSLAVIAAVALPLIAVLIYLQSGDSEQAATEVIVEAPRHRQVAAEQVPDLPLADITSESGIDFVHESGRAGEKLLPETMGSGVAVFDFNEDGHQDLLFVNSQAWPWETDAVEPSPSRLYAGDGTGSFRDVTLEAGLDHTVYGMGCAVGDIDNDGDADLFLSAVGRNRLFRNDDGRFVDVTERAGVAGADDAWSTSCGFLDYDNDGLLDLFVGNYVQWSRDADLSQSFTLVGGSRAYGPPRAFSGTFCYLYHNEGDGTFRDVSAAAGIEVRNPDTGVPLGKSLGVMPVDFDGDGWIDVAVANDTVRNFLFHNQRDGTFAEIGQLANIAYDRSGNARGAMGIDCAVFRDDGTLAIGMGNFANEPSALFMSRPGRMQFVDAAMFTGFGPPTRQALTFGLFFFDVDLDGRLDLFGSNGHLEEEISKTQSTQSYPQPPQLFWNAGPTAPSELVLVGGEKTGEAFQRPIVGRGAAYGDWDEDGDQDIVVTTSGSSPRLFRNDQATGHHSLRVTVEGTTSNRDGIGAAVQLELGKRTLTRHVTPTRSYLSQCEPVATFGLGQRPEVEGLVVTWPGGEKERFPVEGTDRRLHLVEGTGKPVPKR